MKAIIFDMDGVISDTTDLHIKTQKNLFKKYKIKTNNLEEFAGVKIQEIIKKKMKESKVNLTEKEINLIADEYWQILTKKASVAKPMPGIKEIVVKLKDNGFRLGVASSSNKQFVHALLNNFRLRSFFEVIITGDQAKKGKPSPDIFLLAAKRLNVLPEECIVIEDSLVGMKAAKKAKMKCVGIISEKDSAKYPCNICLESTKKIDVDNLNELM
jgi:beta-phosphoglucomutase family hydrolase